MPLKAMLCCSRCQVVTASIVIWLVEYLDAFSMPFWAPVCPEIKCKSREHTTYMQFPPLQVHVHIQYNKQPEIDRLKFSLKQKASGSGE